MVSVWKKSKQKMGNYFVFCIIPMLILLLWFSAIPITAYADEGSLIEIEEIKEEEESGEGEENENGEETKDGEEIKDGGNAFLDAMLDSVFGISEEKDGSGFSTYEMLDEADRKSTRLNSSHP